MLINLMIYTFIFIFGITIGSFLNVCILRIPEGENIVTQRSHCMNCGYILKWYDLLPVISFLILKGHCRNCHAKISLQYPCIELLNGFLYVLIVAVRGGFQLNTQFPTGSDISSILFCLTASALLVLSIIDLRTYEIPVKINLFLLMIGLIRLGIDMDHWKLYIIGLFSISALLGLIYLVSGGRAIGGGDVKLMAVGGLLLGVKCIVPAFLIGCLLGSVIHIVRMKLRDADRILALGPYLSLGMLVTMLYGEKLWNWYISAFLTYPA